ncbi:DEAD/DEAH box helicase [Clostridium butyricum]|uniref:DEAD/DEAH box helicase n=1 Tax=Clostridium butyricum TaxID=1492 RepID=UPI003F8F2880
MNDTIHKMVEDAIIDGKYDFINKVWENIEQVDKYKISTAVRLIKAWKKFQENSMYQTDFECALRNYLLLLKKDIFIKNYKPSDNFSRFGLTYDENNGRIWANSLLPSYVNSQLIKQTQMQDIALNKEKSKHNIWTTPYIHKLTGFNKFKSYEQKMAVIGALKAPKGYTTLVSMSTGGGKSLVTQTVAYQDNGLTIVIVPTISLMIDQASNAKKIIKFDVENEIFYYHSGDDMSNLLKALKKRSARLLFISPESIIKNPRLHEAVIKANEDGYLKNIVIDEAHIIIEWGSAFRIDFQCLDALRKTFIKVNPDLRTYLLSATYSNDTIRQLKNFYSEHDNWIEIRCDRLRHELRYDIIKAASYGDKKRKMIELIEMLPHPMIVYVKSPDDAEQLKNTLNDIGFANIHTFTGRTQLNQREKIIKKWVNDEFDLMIATCAFGVGVDKKDVRTVLHTYIPENPNRYYQEAGRGGRDGLPCLSTILFTDKDIESAFAFVSKVITTEKLMGRWFSMLESPRTISLLDNKYNIDTYVKPLYNTSEEYFDSISDQDVSWNVYVILFLRRNGYLTIDDVQYVDNKYLFYITLKNRRILNNNVEIEQEFDMIRNQEWEKNEADFTLIKTNLERLGKLCWSSMFNKVYTLTDEYCAGCNNHNEIIDFEEQTILKKHIDSPLSKIDNRINEYSYGSKSLIIINEMINVETINKVIDLGADSVVADNGIIETCINQIDKSDINRKAAFYEYNEFTMMTKADKFYVSGAVIIVFPEDVSMQKRILSIIEINSKKYDIEYIILTKEDYYLQYRNKCLSEVIDGPCKQDF